MSKLDDILDLLQHHRLIGIYSEGFRGTKQDLELFHPSPITIYLEFEERYLRLTTPDRGHLHLDVISEIQVDPELLDADLALGDLGYFYLGEGAYFELEVVRLRAILDKDSNLNQGIVRCVGLELKHRTLFFDPANTFGIYIGHEEQIVPNLLRTVEEIASGVVYEEFTWRRREQSAQG